MTLLPAFASRKTRFPANRRCGRPRRAAESRRHSRPRLELLEERALLTIVMVENSNDNGAGSLRNTIATAAPGETIEFDMSAGHVTSPITLTGGELTLAQNVKIIGPGSGSLTISGNESSMVFLVVNAADVTISGLTIAEGQNAAGPGALLNYGQLELSDDVFSTNAGGTGGAVDNQSGSLSMSGCTIANNTALTGGGLYIAAGTVTIESSTLQGNHAGNVGGGLDNVGGTLSVINSTLADNTAPSGGGLSNVGTTTLINSTVADNTATTGGGINNQGTFTLGNTIVAGNTGLGADPDFAGSVTTDLGNNLIGDDAGSSGLTGPSDLLNVNPLLGTLGDYGGPTQTFPLSPGSPAIDAGNQSLVPAGIATDQRGFSRFVNGATDIGAFEVQFFLVLNTADHGPGSLRTAMTNANLAGGSTIFFATSGTISLLSPLPEIDQLVDVAGPGANVLTVDGSAEYQVFAVLPDATAYISGLTINDGFSSGNGGGIENAGTLTLTDCTVSNSSASNDGGGFANDSLGTMTMIGCTVSGNSSPNDGGGIENDGTLTLINSTIADNSASSGVGGGINNTGTLTLINTTVAGNTAYNGGGLGASGVLTLANTIVADNTLSGGGTAPDFFGNVTTDSGNNLIGDSSGSGGFAQISDLLNVNPLLSSLGFHSGPTQTMTLLPGSPAIDAGDDSLAFWGGNPLTVDQRGMPRLVGTAVDIGAIECQGFTITVVSGNDQQATVNSSFASSLQVLVASAFGEPVSGGMVTLTAPGSGASATFPGDIDTATIDSSGIAGIGATANTVAGGYSVGAAAQGASTTQFSLTNLPGAATQLVIHTQPSPTAMIDVAFSTQPIVYVEDQYGNLETGDNATQVTATSLPGGSGPLQGTTTVTASGGIATFTNLADDNVETITIQFTSAPALTTATSNSVVVTAPPTQLVVHTEPSATATAGVAFSTHPVAYVEDQFGNLETNDNTTEVTVALSVGTGPLLGTTTVTVSGGVATFSNLADDTAETIALQFTSVPVLTSAASNNIVVSPAAATQLVIQTEPSASATAGVSFSTQPVVYEEDQFGNLETGDNTTEVTAAPLPLGSGPLQGSTTVTVSGGIATFTDLADDTAETISLQFTSAPILTSADSSNIVVSPAAASQLAIHTEPSPTATAGVAFGTQPVVYVEDQFGNLETGDNATDVTVALSAGAGPLLGTMTVTASGGIASFTDLADDTAETIALQFTSVPVLTSAASNNIVVSPAAASQLVIQTEPSASATAGVAFSTQPVVYVEDQFGNLETGDNTTEVTAASLPLGSGPLQGTTTVTVSGGIATFTNLADDTAETLSLQFTSSPVLTSANSSNIVVSPAAASQLAIHTEPSPTATAGVAISTQPVIYVEDQFGNLETLDNATEVTAALSVGTGPLLGTATVTVSGGIATFTGLADDTAETITLQFTSTPVLTPVNSSNIVVSPALATQLAIQTEPSATATAGSPFSTQPVVFVEDQFGNVETGDNLTQVTAALSLGSGPLLGTTTVTVTGGIATFTNLADDTAETIALQFTSSPVLTTETSSNIVVNPAAATQLVIQTEPSASATAGVAFSTQPVVYEEDQFGNLETGDNTTDVTAASLPLGSGPLEGSTTVTVSGGIATFTNLADDTAETISLQFTSAPVLTSANSSNIVVSPAAAIQLIIQTEPSQSATAGVAFSTQPVVAVEDQFGNVETGDNTTQVTAGLRLGSGPLLGTTTVTVTGGIATFTNLVDDTAELIALQFTSAPALTAETSSLITVSPAAASQLVIHTEPSASATAGVAFSTQPVVYEEDQFGNLETGDNTTEVTAASLPLGSGPLEGTTTVIVSGGIATFANLAEDTAETISLHFTSSPALNSANSSNVVVSPAAASQLAIQTEPSPTATAGLAFSMQPVIYVEDQFGNLETTDNATEVTAALSTGTGPLLGTATVTVSGGIATFTGLSDDTAETITLRFTSTPVLTPVNSGNIVVSPASATQLAIHTEPSATATAGVDFSTQPVILVEDQFGNVETGDNLTQVTAALSLGSGPLLGTTTVTVSGGVATFTNLHDDNVETIALQFTCSPVLTTVTSSNIVVSPGPASQLVVQTEPSSSATAGLPFSTQPVVYVEDQYGNLETGDNSTEVTAALSVGSGPLFGTMTVTASGGIASFTDLADDTAETISLQFTSAPILTSADSSNIVVSPAAASQLVIQTEPSPTATAGVAFGTQPVVYVEDQFGNLETGDNATDVTASARTPAAVRCWER